MKMVDPMTREMSRQLNLPSTDEQVLYLSMASADGSELK